MLPALRFESVDERGGVLLVRARSRRVAARFLFFGMGLGEGADEHELQIEPERGVVLRVESRLEGEPFDVSELLDARFDEELPDELFTLELPPGERAVSPRELHAHNLPLEEIAAQRVLHGVRDRGASRGRVARPRPPHEAARGTPGVRRPRLLPRRRARGHLVTERRAKRRGRRRFPGDRRAVVTVERDGTRIELASEELGEDELRALADGARPRVIAIALLTLVPGELGGSETYVRELLRGLARSGALDARVYLPPVARDSGGGLPFEVVEEYRPRTDAARAADGDGGGRGARRTRFAARRAATSSTTR